MYNGNGCRTDEDVEKEDWITFSKSASPDKNGHVREIEAW